MDAHALVYPMFAMVLLTALALGRLFAARMAAVRAGTADARYFKTYQVGGEPESTAQLSRNFSNLFEAPTLFFPACLVALVLGATSTPVVVLAWLYVGARGVHTWVHTGRNVLNHRIAAYFTSWLLLLALWTMVVVEAARAG